MKKFKLIFIIFIIFLPLSVNAESKEFKWVETFCNNSNLTSCISYGNNAYFNTSLYHSVSSGTTYIKDIYIGNVTFNSGIYNNVDLPILVDFSGDTLLTSASEISTTDSGYEIMVSQGYTIQFNIYNGSAYQGACKINGYSNSDMTFEGVISCPIFSNSTTITRIRINLHHYFSPLVISENSSAQVGANVGISGNWVFTKDDTSTIINSQNQTTNAINSVDNSINDSTGNSNSDNSNAINSFNQNIASNGTISSLIVMPISLYQKVLNSVNGTCTNFSLGSLLGTEVVFNCINPSNFLGSTLWGVIDIIISGLFVWHISKKMIEIFNNFSSLKDSNDIIGGDS